MKRISVLLSIWLLLMAVTAGAKNGPDNDEALPPLLIGLVPEQNIFRQLERYRPLAEYLSKKINRSIKLKVLPGYGKVVEEFVSSGMDGAFLGSFAYILSHMRVGVEPLARPEAVDGSSMYSGVIFVHKESGIKGIRNMSGKRLALVDSATTAGYLFPLSYFSAHGVDDYKTYFGEVYFTGTHEDAILDVLNRKTDVGAAKSTVFYRMAAADKRIGRDLVILARSREVPETTLAMRKQVDPSVKAAMLQTLLEMHTDPAGQKVLANFGARRFVATTDKDYQAVVEYAHHIRIHRGRGPAGEQ